MFQVTYNSEHTCNHTTTSNKYNDDNDLPHLSYSNAEGVVTIPTSHAMKEQEQGPLSSLVEVSTLCLDSMPTEDPFCFSSHYTLNPYQADDLVMEMSNIPCVRCDGYLDIGPVALPVETLEDTPFNDLELDELFDSSWIDN